MTGGPGSRTTRGQAPATLGPSPPNGISSFGAILRRAVQAAPGAIGGAFADSDGEMIDSFTTRDPHDWALLTAHYGIVLSQLHAAFGTWHFGGPEYFIAQHELIDVVVQAVPGGYYALLAVAAPVPLGHPAAVSSHQAGPEPLLQARSTALGHALRSLREAARELHREMQ